MTRNEILRRWPNAVESFIKANLDPDDSRKTPKLEPNPGNGAMGKAQAKKGTSQKFLVRVTSIRKRLLDEDNLCEKYHVDLCRYAGIIPKDSPGTTSIKVGQRKAEKGEEENTVIEIFKL